jgi:ribose transport system substrate-binding protein
MKENIIRFVFAAILLTALQIFLFSQEKLKIAVIPKSSTALFWKSVHSGVRLGGLALGGVEVVWKATSKENDIAQQIATVEQCVSENVSAIIIAPLDKEALAGPVAKATKKKIPVLVFDSALKGTPGKDYISYVGIDNKKAGIAAGEQLVKILGGKGNVVILRYRADQSNNITSREEGFLEVIEKHSNINVIDKDHFVSGTVDEARDECLKMANKLKEADGIFCSYEQSTLGMLLALRNLNLTGKVKFIGFDTPAAAVEALKKGEISALMAQDPTQMGYRCVKTIVDYVRGKKVDVKVDIDVRVITRDNLNDPDIQKVLALPGISD